MDPGKIQIAKTKLICSYIGDIFDVAELVTILRTARDPAMLTFAWKSWRDVVGPPSRPRFVRLVELSNAAAKRNGEF